MAKNSVEPKFVDGVIDLCSLLHEASYDAIYRHYNLLFKDRIVPDAGSFSLGTVEKDIILIDVYVDFAKVDDITRLTGFFVINNRIIRFLPVSFDTALLLPSKNHSDNSRGRVGVSYERLLSFKRSKGQVMFRFRRLPLPNFDKLIYDVVCRDFSFSRTMSTIDDLGMPYYKFPDIKELSLHDVPNYITDKTFHLVGKQYYAPFTTNEMIHCVLFAQLDNPYDDKAIKILRWLPTLKEKNGLPRSLKITEGDIFFELGYISRTENEDLYTFMNQNDSRLLFATCVNDEIKIDGGVKSFRTNQFEYPKCLYKIDLR